MGQVELRRAIRKGKLGKTDKGVIIDRVESMGQSEEEKTGG